MFMFSYGLKPWFFSSCLKLLAIPSFPGAG